MLDVYVLLGSNYHERRQCIATIDKLSGVWLELIGVKHVTTENAGLSVLVVTEAFV